MYCVRDANKKGEIGIPTLSNLSKISHENEYLSQKRGEPPPHEDPLNPPLIPVNECGFSLDNGF